MSKFAFHANPETRTQKDLDEIRHYTRPTDARDRGPNAMDKFLSEHHGTPVKGSGSYVDVAKHHGYERYGARAGGRRGVLWNHPSGSALTFESTDKGPERNPVNAETWHFSHND